MPKFLNLLLTLVATGFPSVPVIASSPAISALSPWQLARDLQSGARSSVAVVTHYLDRIRKLDDAGPRLNAVIETNPDALAIAAELDRHLQQQGPKGPLHGMPVLLKDNIDTGDQQKTSAGSAALAAHRADSDADLVTKLRDAGAVILGKTNLSEWANFRSTRSSSGWSSRGGQTRNPYVLDRNPCGSSSGSGVAVSAMLTPLAVGTETNGSIVCPASINGIVGIKPTLGLISRRGIVPIAHSQDTAGPMATSVWAAALLLQSMLSFDADDPRAKSLLDVSVLPDRAERDLTGVRIGIIRGYPGEGDAAVDALYQGSIEALRELGAEIVDPLDLEPAPELREAEFTVLLYEFKHNLNAYLASAGVAPDRDTLAELIAFNQANSEQIMPWFGQEIFLMAQAQGELDDDAYQQAVLHSGDAMRERLDTLFDRHSVDLLLVPSNSPAWKTDWVKGDHFAGVFTAGYAAISGYPSVTVPAGFIHKLPVGVSFIGPALSDAAVIQAAYVFEQHTQARRMPQFVPTLETD